MDVRVLLAVCERSYPFDSTSEQKGTRIGEKNWLSLR